MKILFDLTFINPYQSTGVSTFAFRLLKGLKNAGEDVNISLLASHTNFNYIKEILPDYEILNIHGKHKSLEKLLQAYYYDIYYNPFFTIKSIVPKGVISLATVHDIQPIRLNGIIKNYLFVPILYRKFKKLDGIVTISEFSSNCIKNKFPQLKNNITVIHNSVDIRSSCASYKRIKGRYILNVNAIEEYKNQISILYAFASIKDKIPHCLVFKGKKTKYWESVLQPIIDDNNLGDRIFLISDNLSSEDLSDLYSSADLFVNTSVMEGFGFTPIEAAINQVPVLTTQCDALYETTQGKLNYINDPYDIKEISSKILFLLNNRMTKNRLEEISKFYSSFYSLEKQANAYINYFKRFAK